MSCELCDHGWIEATPTYVETLFPYPEDATDVQRAHVDQRRAHAGEHVFPCPTCRPDLFERWENGCLRADHRALVCELCIEKLGERGARSHDRAAQPGGGAL